MMRQSIRPDLGISVYRTQIWAHSGVIKQIMSTPKDMQAPNTVPEMVANPPVIIAWISESVRSARYGRMSRGASVCKREVSQIQEGVTPHPKVPTSTPGTHSSSVGALLAPSSTLRSYQHLPHSLQHLIVYWLMLFSVFICLSHLFKCLNTVEEKWYISFVCSHCLKPYT